MNMNTNVNGNVAIGFRSFRILMSCVQLYRFFYKINDYDTMVTVYNKTDREDKREGETAV